MHKCNGEMILRIRKSHNIDNCHTDIPDWHTGIPAECSEFNECNKKNIIHSF